MGERIGRAQSLLGSMLNIKPLIGLEDGEIAPLGRGPIAAVRPTR